MSLSKEENVCVCFFFCLRNEEFVTTYGSSADILRQFMLVRKRILELHSNKKRTKKQTKCGTRSENSLLQYEAVHKKNLRRKEENHF
jgi:hypothetical protein